MKNKLMIILSLVLIVVFSFPVYSEYNRDNPENMEQSAKYYENAKVVRVKYVRGEAFINRGYNEGVEEATANLSVFEGDSAGTTDGRLEIYLGKLNYLRLDYDTKLKFIKVPALRRTKTTLHLQKGGIYLDISNIDDEKDIVIQTEDCGLFILKRGLYRINVRENGKTEIFVFDGLAEVAGNDYSRNVRENQKTVMRSGSVIERPFYFYSTDDDDFDQWNKTRMGTYEHQRYSSARYLNKGYEDQEYELTRAGRWQYNDEYNTNVWMPYNVSSSWRPYSNGRWVWNPVYGYVWTSYDSWGHFTHHYGRWHWGSMNGWYWLPGYRWSPAWVSWCGSGSYWGWSPLSYYNRPVVVMNGRWNRRYRYRNGIPWNSRSMIIIKKNQLMAPRINKVSLRRGELSRLTKRNMKYRGIAPKTIPVFKRVSVINARGNKISYKRNGVLSYKKHKTSNKTSLYKRAKKTGLTKYKAGGLATKPSYKYSSGSKYKKTTVYKKSPVKSATSRYKYKYKSNETNSRPDKTYRKSTTTKKIKKKRSSPYTYNSGTSNKGYSTSSKTYGTTSYKSKYKSKSYSTPTYKSKYSSKTYSDYTPKSYSTPSYKSKSSYKSYSTPSYKSNSSYKKSSKSYSTPSRSSKSYSRPKTSYKSSSSSSRGTSSSSSSSKKSKKK